MVSEQPQANGVKMPRIKEVRLLTHLGQPQCLVFFYHINEEWYALSKDRKIRKGLHVVDHLNNEPVIL